MALSHESLPTRFTLKQALNTVRRRLMALVLLMLVPTTAVSLVAALSLYTDERDAVAAAALETAKALSLVADREFAVRAAVLRTLAGSPALQRGDLQTFHEEAKAAAPSFENTVILVAPDGQQVINTRVPYGQGPLPKSRSSNLQREVKDSGMSVSDLYMAPLGKQPSFAVYVPVKREGATGWYLGMGSFASQLQRVFAQQTLPEGWVGGLYDGNGVLVARNTEPERFVGRAAPAELLAVFPTQTHGFAVTKTFNGVPVQAVFHRAPDSGWTVALGLPMEALRRPAWRAFGAMMLISLLFTAATLALALWLGRSIVQPVRQLQGDAEALGRGEVVDERDTGLYETDVVQHGLARASRDRWEAEGRLQETVQEAVAETERAQRAALGAQKLEALGRLTGGIAHDFNNLLQTMTTGLQIASRLSNDDRARSALLACERALSKAVKLTRQLLTFGRVQPGHLETVDVATQLGGLAELVHGAVSTAIAVKMKVDPDVWPVHIDPVQLELAILNLAINSRDAIANHGEIVIEAGNRTLGDGEVPDLPAGEYVRIAVTDNGEGMSPEHLQHVFEPFFTTKPVGKGSGLGLAQVYGFTRKSLGTATVDSEERRGTTVTLWLPRSHRPVTVMDPGALPVEPGTFHGTVLLVEDDSLVRGTTSQALEDLGFKVVVAGNADDAMSLVKVRDDIDVVLSDIVMPGPAVGSTSPSP